MATNSILQKVPARLGTSEEPILQELDTIVERTESVVELMKRVTGIDIERCKHCKIGQLETIQLIQPHGLYVPTPYDTS